MSPDDSNRVSRRSVLAASAATAAVPAGAGATVGVGTVSGSVGRTDSPTRWDRRCPDATLEPSHEPCPDATMAGCDDEHPETIALQEAVREHLESQFASVGALLDAGFVPYFDALDRDEDGWSHWLNPAYIGDDGVLDPDRPESVLVDNDRWIPIGVMFIATRGGDPVDPPPVYGDEDADERCSPWHYHRGLPGRFAWWFYEHVYVDDRDPGLRLPCRTPCMLHVWTVDHPGGVYAHGGPPPAAREGPAAETAGFDTDADPGVDRLGWDVLPENVLPERLPSEFSWADR